MIKLHGKDDEQAANLARLNALLGNSGARVKVDGGKVVFDAHATSEDGQKHAGYKLLNRIIAHQHDVLIGVHPQGKAGEASMVPYEVPNASKLGTGSRAFIHAPKQLAPDVQNVYDKQTQTFARAATPDHVQLGHELVHADHAQRGTMTPYDQFADNRVAGNLAGYGAFDTTMREKQEELVTIGLAKGHDTDDISENSLRESLGLLPRASNARIERHLLDEHVGHVKRIEGDRNAEHARALDHAKKAEERRMAAQAAHERMTAAQQAEAAQRAVAERAASDNQPFVDTYRGSGDLNWPGVPGLTGDQIADAHQANIDRENGKLTTLSSATAQHLAEREQHADAHRGHKADYERSAEAVRQMESAMKTHHEKYVTLGALLK